MEKFTLTYKPIFSIEIWHDYFLRFYKADNPYNLLNQLPLNYALNNFIQLKPTKETAELLKNFGLKYRENSRGLTIYAQASELSGGNFVTFIPVDISSKFTFEIHSISPYLMNFTGLPINDFDILYFNNLQDNKTDDGLYLSQKMDAYNSTISYDLGDLLYNNDQIYESIADASITGGLGDNNKWQSIDYKNDVADTTIAKGINHVTKKDYLTSVEKNWFYKANNTSPSSSISFTLKDFKNNTIALGNVLGTNIPQSPITTPPSTMTEWEHQLNLTHIPDGKYTIQVDSANYDFYYFNQIKAESLIGIIEIFPGTSIPDYQFLTAGSNGIEISSKIFKVRFKNRITKWKYYLKGDTDNTPARELLLPLSANYIQLADDLPNANIFKIYPQKNGTNQLESVCSEIYLYDKII